MKILMVENERLIASQVTSLLVEWGHDILYCGNDGRTLLTSVEHHPPDLILTGFHLKGTMKSIELLDRLWARWQIPVVVVSAAEVTDLPLAWQTRPGLFFLAKPFLASQLHGIIEKALQQPSP